MANMEFGEWEWAVNIRVTTLSLGWENFNRGQAQTFLILEGHWETEIRKNICKNNRGFVLQ